MYKVLTHNNISPAGLDLFDASRYEVGPDVQNPDAILLRSHKLHDTKIPDSVKIITRAGAGTNNIPTASVTELGIPVLNTPGANANAVKELVITGMLLACRNICGAWESVHQIADDHDLKEKVEKQKKQFAGFELPGKTLGVIGLGHIGVKVANAACALNMNVIGFDPAVTVQNAWELSANVEQAEHINDVLQKSDFLTIHVPLNDKTRHLINAASIKQMKFGSIILNFAREGIIDNDAIINAIEQKHIARYVCDFPDQALLKKSEVICLPHLGASTREAEENCAIMAAQQIMAFLEQGHIKHSINFPAVKMPNPQKMQRVSIINKNVPNMVAQISTVLSNAQLNIVDMINKSRNDIAYTLIDLDKPIDEQALATLQSIDGVIRVRSIN